MESFPEFNKLWGHMWNITLYKNVTYSIDIENRFEVTRFGGKKYVYISEVNVMGGKSRFLGIAFLISAGVVGLIMIFFQFLYF